MLKDWSAAHTPWGLSTEMTTYVPKGKYPYGRRSSSGLTAERIPNNLQ